MLVARLIVGLTLLGWLGLVLAAQRPPAVQLGAQPPEAFSTERALQHARAIAERPHPLGSPDQARVRDYLVRTLADLGLAVEVQRASVRRQRRSGAIVTGQVENVIARLPGTANTRAVLLAAHYDSVPAGPGANDDGAAVAALLETARALKAGPPPRNDVIILLTDGEEAGLLGAQAFLERPGVAGALGVAFNFEARGADGPALMFETSPQNGALVRAFAQTAPAVFANSLSYEVYRLLPNDTDFSLFKAAGVPGLNFAFIDGYTAYHTANDRLERLHVAGMQQHGQTALALARAFGARDLHDLRAPNLVYFDLFGRVLLAYPGWLALPLALLLALGWLALLRRGLRAGSLTPGRLLRGALLLPLAMVLALLLGLAAAPLLGAPHPEFAVRGDTNSPGLNLAGLAALTLALVALMFGWARPRLGLANLAAGALLCWVLLALLCAALLPGASYLFTWAPAAGLAGLWPLVGPDDPEQALARRWPALLLCALPALLLLAPVIALLAVALTLRLIGVALAMSVLTLGLLTPLLLFLAGTSRRLPAAAAALGLVLLLLAAAL